MTVVVDLEICRNSSVAAAKLFIHSVCDYPSRYYLNYGIVKFYILNGIDLSSQKLLLNDLSTQKLCSII